MTTASIENFDLTILDNSVFAIINNLWKQHKCSNLDKIYNELIKTMDYKNTSKEYLHNRINELTIQGKIINKPNRKNDLYCVNESIVDFNIEQSGYSNLLTSDLSFATPYTKQSSSIDLVNTPRNPINTIPETPNLPQKDINSKESVKRIIESETFSHNISKKLKTESLKPEMFSSLESSFSFYFRKT